MQAGELHVDARGERLHREGLGQAGHAFEQHVSVGQQAHQQPFDQVLLADDDLADFVQQWLYKRAGPLHVCVDGADTGMHCDSTAGWTTPVASAFRQTA